MSEAYQYNAFISYRHRKPDGDVAVRVQSMLESFRAPKGTAGGKTIRKIFRDTSELPTSGDLDTALKDALASSEYLIVVLSEAFQESKWCMEEVRAFRDMHGGRTNHILPILVSGEPEDVIPEILRFEDVRETLPDGSEQVTRREKEPICADVRADSPRKQNARLKTEVLRLAAPLLGCGFDDLYQRHRKRKKKQAAAVLSLAAAVVLGFAGLILRNNLQISRKNEQLDNANTTLTAQQQELLTQEAQQAFQDGDKLRALRKALAALPRDTAGSERPVYAPAEGVLWQLMEERLNKTGDTDRYLFGTVLSQDLQIEAYCVSSDARYEYVLDKNSTVRCYETFTGRLVWEKDIQGDIYSCVSGTFSLLLAEKHGCLVVKTALGNGRGYATAYILTVLDPSTGEELWSRRFDGGYISTPVLSPDGDHLAFITMSDSVYRCNLYDIRNGFTADSPYAVFPGADSGSQRIVRFDEKLLSFDPEDPCTLICVFSEDSRQHVLFMDAEGRQISEAVPESAGISAGNSITKICRDKDSGRIFLGTSVTENKISKADFWCVEPQSGTLLWHFRMPEEKKSNEWIGQLIYNSENRILLANLSGFLITLNPDDGSLISKDQEYDSEILYPAPNSMYAGFTNNASDEWSGISWIAGISGNKLVMTTGEELGLSLLKPAMNDNTVVYSEGIIRAEWAGEEDDPGLQPRKGSGFVSFLSAQYPFSLCVNWNQSFPELWKEQCTLPLAEGEYMFPVTDERLVLNTDGRIWFLVQNIFGTESEGEKTYPCRLVGLDPQGSGTREMSFPIRLDLTRWDLSNCRFLPAGDAKGAVIDLEGRELYYFDASSGEMNLLFRDETESSAQANRSGYYWIHPCDVLAAWQDRDGTALAAACDREKLLLWQDGPVSREVPLPEGMVWQTEADVPFNHILSTGSNGWVVLSAYPDAAAETVNAFACFEVSSGTWHMVPDEAHGNSGRLIVPAHREPLFAVTGTDRTICVYNMQQERCLHQISLPVPENAIYYIGFSDDDRYLFLHTTDTFLIYDAESGDLLYDNFIHCSLPVTVTSDPELRRLYICSNDQYAIGEDAAMIDCDTWTLIAAPQDIRAFLPESGLMVKYGDILQKISFVSFPSAQDLIDAGTAAISRLESEGIPGK